MNKRLIILLLMVLLCLNCSTLSELTVDENGNSLIDVDQNESEYPDNNSEFEIETNIANEEIMDTPIAEEANQISEETADNLKWVLWSGNTQLRGANIYQRELYIELDGTEFLGSDPVGPPYLLEDFIRLRELGANYVNISHPGVFTTDLPYEVNMDVVENLDRLLDLILQADMFVVISYRTGPGRSEFTFFWDEVGDWFDESWLNDRVWGDEEAQQAWVDMWRFTAERYRDLPHVVGYDLMVEPNSNETGSDVLHNPLDIWEPEEFYEQYDSSLYDWNQFFPQIVEAVRQVDTLTPILVGGNGYSALDWLPWIQVVEDEHIVYMAHQYEPFLYTHQDANSIEFEYPSQKDTNWDGELEQFDQDWFEERMSMIEDFRNEFNKPVAINEYGVVRWVPGAADFMQDQMSVFESFGVNYALWVWDPDWEPMTSQLNYFNFQFGPDPENTEPVTNDLQDVIIEFWSKNTVYPSNYLH